ncbi:uncharacterized protein LOC142985138 isoform X3 [Anticarsia gemmatalis]|uniref:uncharacterized protein LOC142985138 isoform X3 n=1 Tax=Anticarsia gemmatalis TaxID=129554 RepID=UPI003F75D8B9
MAAGNSEINTYFGKCRCCLNYGYLKNMWEEHYWEGEKEIYVEMLVQCFGLSWQHSEDSMENDQICESCINRLREANNFKKTVLDSQERLLEQADEDSLKPDTKFLIDNSQDEHDSESAADDNMFIDDPDDPNYVDPDDPADPDDPNIKYEDVEYLEEEDDKTAGADAPRRRSKTPAVIPPDSKWPRKLPKADRYKTYKRYTEEALRKCLEAVRNQELTPTQASEKFNVPKKTIIAKVRSNPKEDEKEKSLDYKALSKEKMYNLVQEIKTILTYTNATPFRSNANKYLCIYCSHEGPFFDDAADLRTHTRTQHVTDRATKIEYALRPFWSNEILKLDVDNLLCNVCCIPMSTWNEMFKHLKDDHQIVLDEAYTRVIPYKLSTDLQCALCKETFTNYMHLDGHMNAHYNNYVCDDCGDTFLTATRLKQHAKIHAAGKFPCSICNKTFKLAKYQLKHEHLVHKLQPKFKCNYCEERFFGEYLRHVHLLEAHKDKVKIITCEICGKTYTWRAYYVAHKKKKHSDEPKKLSCTFCDKKYFDSYDLREHMITHSSEKQFTCDICDKKLISSGSLRHHMAIHKRKGHVKIKSEEN